MVLPSCTPAGRGCRAGRTPHSFSKQDVIARADEPLRPLPSSSTKLPSRPCPARGRLSGSELGRLGGPRHHVDPGGRAGLSLRREAAIDRNGVAWGSSPGRSVKAGPAAPAGPARARDLQLWERSRR